MREMNVVGVAGNVEANVATNRAVICAGKASEERALETNCSIIAGEGQQNIVNMVNEVHVRSAISLFDAGSNLPSAVICF